MRFSGKKIGAFPFDPDRIVHTIHFGKYRGHHFIYKTLDSFRKYEENAVLTVPWYSVKPGNWTKTDCGHYMQCLNISILTNRKGQKTYLFRFPAQSDYIFFRKNGTFDARDNPEYRFLFRYSLQDRRHLRANGPSRMKKKSSPPWSGSKAKLVNFVKYWGFENMPPYLAYMKAYKINSPRVARRHADLLIASRISIIKDVMIMYKKLFDDEGLTDSDMVKRISQIAREGKNQEKLAAMRLALQLRGELSSKDIPNPTFQPITNNTQIIVGSTQDAKTLGAAMPRLKLPSKKAIEAETITIEASSDESNRGKPDAEIKNLRKYIDWKDERLKRKGLTVFRRSEISPEGSKTQVDHAVFNEHGDLITEVPNHEQEISSYDNAASQE